MHTQNSIKQTIFYSQISSYNIVYLRVIQEMTKKCNFLIIFCIHIDHLRLTKRSLATTVAQAYQHLTTHK